MEEPNKRRRSNFDVTPDQLTNSTVISSQLTTGSASNSLIHVVDAKTSQMHIYTSVHEIVFLRKLELAMEKNFSYIERLDAVIAAKLSGHYIEDNLHKSPKESKKFSKVMNKNKAIPVVKLGIGAKQESNVHIDIQPKKLSSSVYINNLPLDFTREEIDILFSPQGNIKKIKLYQDSQGKNKGDALVTYANPDHAAAACLKLNQLDIGDGHIISVELAKFNSNANTDNNKNEYDPELKEDVAKIKHCLTLLIQEPIGEEASVVIISNAFEKDAFISDTSFYTDVEMEMMLTASRYGELEAIYSINAPSLEQWQSYINGDNGDINNFNFKEVFGEEGCFIVIYRYREAASKLYKEWNNHPRKINMYYILGSRHDAVEKFVGMDGISEVTTLPFSGDTKQVVVEANEDTEADVTASVIATQPSSSMVIEGSETDAVLYTSAEADGLDDFFNSLL